MYKILDSFKKINGNMEGFIIEDQQGKKYLTNGLFIWSLIPKREKQIQITKNINTNKVFKLWNKYFPYSNLVF